MVRRKSKQVRTLRKRRKSRIQNVRSWSIGAHPPVIQAGKWYIATAARTETSITNLDAAKISSTLCDLYGLYMNSLAYRIPIIIQIKWIKVWQMSQTDQKSCLPISLECHSLVDTSDTPDKLFAASSYPARNQFARIGFQWPYPHNRTVFEDTGLQTIARIVASNGATFMWQMGLWWRPTNVGPSAAERLVFSRFLSVEDSPVDEIIHTSMHTMA